MSFDDKEHHATPDGKFRLVVDADDQIGFEGYSWVIHADQLDVFRVEPKVTTVAELLEALAARRLVLILSRFLDESDEIQDVWISHDAEGELSVADEGETIEVRYWDGAPYEGR